MFGYFPRCGKSTKSYLGLFFMYLSVRKKKTALPGFFLWWTCGDARRSVLFWPASDARPSSALDMCNTKKWKCWDNLFSHIKWTKLHKFCHRRNSEAETGMKCNNGTTRRRLNSSLLGHLSSFCSTLRLTSCHVVFEAQYITQFCTIRFDIFFPLPGKSLEVM